MKKEEKSSTIHRFNIVFINIQLLLTVVTVVLGIWFIFDSKLMQVFQLFLGLDLLIMAYNNQIIYHRKKATVIYAVLGILLLILDLLMFIGV